MTNTPRWPTALLGGAPGGRFRELPCGISSTEFDVDCTSPPRCAPAAARPPATCWRACRPTPPGGWGRRCMAPSESHGGGPSTTPSRTTSPVGVAGGLRSASRRRVAQPVHADAWTYVLGARTLNAVRRVSHVRAVGDGPHEAVDLLLARGRLRPSPTGGLRARGPDAAGGLAGRVVQRGVLARERRRVDEVEELHSATVSPSSGGGEHVDELAAPTPPRSGAQQEPVAGVCHQLNPDQTRPG